jgi:glutathione synthase/RimK-type ligase-like ATP-grasp enzyme
VPVDPPPIARALALSAARAAGVDLVGVDLLPTGNGFVVIELNGAVEFRAVYAPHRDVFADAVGALIGDGARQPLLAAASA